MRILVCTGLYPPDIGGPATYSKLLFDGLPEYGIDATVLSFGEVRRWPKVIRHFVYFFKVLKRGREADIIFAQDPVSVGYPAVLAAKILRKKFVLKVVGNYAWEQATQRFEIDDMLDVFMLKKYGWRTELLRKIQRYVARGAQVVITPSEYLKGMVAKWGIGEGKIKVIYNAFTVPKVEMSKQDARNKLGLSGTILVSAGRLVPWKGFDVLIDIMPKILEEIPDAKLVIIGSGPERKMLGIQATSNDLQDKIIFTEGISRSDVLMYLQAGDIFVLNTGYEGFSHQLLEAMAMGIPVVTTKAGGNPETIEAGEEGFLVEYDNKEEIRESIFDIYEEDGLKERVIAGAKEKVSKFTKERMFEELKGLLLKL